MYRKTAKQAHKDIKKIMHKIIGFSEPIWNFNVRGHKAYCDGHTDILVDANWCALWIKTIFKVVSMRICIFKVKESQKGIRT